MSGAQPLFCGYSGAHHPHIMLRFTGKTIGICVLSTKYLLRIVGHFAGGSPRPNSKFPIT